MSQEVVARLKNDWQGKAKGRTKKPFFVFLFSPLTSALVLLRVTILAGLVQRKLRKPVSQATWNRVSRKYLFSLFVVREGPKATATWC